MKKTFRETACLGALLVATGLAWAGGELASRFSYLDNIANTRHNLTLSTLPGGDGGNHDASRNNYGDVCVYCHTPSYVQPTQPTYADPQWNHTVKSNTYQVYGSVSLSASASTPGMNSLTCLSCHDGTTAVDSVVYFPDGRFNLDQRNQEIAAFLGQWSNASGVQVDSHQSLSDGGCLSCHTPESQQTMAPSFRAGLIGVDLRNDHPIGVPYPVYGGSVDFNSPNTVRPGIAFFNTDQDGDVGAGEVRLYDNGDGYKVECASCHDPHGVRSGGPGSSLYPVFLRTNNAHSALCGTCHRK